MLSHKTEEGEGRPSCRGGGLYGDSRRGLMAWVLGGTLCPHPANPPASQREGLGVWGWLCHITLAALGEVPELLDGAIHPQDKHRLRALGDRAALGNAYPGGLLDHLPGPAVHCLQGPARKSLCCAVGLLGTQPRVLVGSSGLHSAFLLQDTLK